MDGHSSILMFARFCGSGSGWHHAERWVTLSHLAIVNLSTHLSVQGCLGVQEVLVSGSFWAPKPLSF